MAEPVQLRCDPPLIEQVVRNLLDNAGRFARSRVTIGCRRDHEQAVIEVVNDGPPVPADDRERIFDRFVRLEDGASSRGATGMASSWCAAP